ncbi:MAG: hypothetical protein LBE70_04140 [Nitrososphaerota archaeon]|nr:hypothetical protein [Nitrososphaerota archaeon]
MKRTNKFSAALMLGVVAGVVAIIAERVDLVITHGTLQLLGFVNTYTWILVSALLFGFWGAILTTEVQAMIGLITITNPALSWLWPFVNLLFALSVGVVAVGFSKMRPNTRTSIKLLFMSFVCALLDIPLVYFVMVTVLGLPFSVYFAALPVYIVLQLLPSTFLSYTLVKALKRSKILYLGEENENNKKT